MKIEKAWLSYRWQVIPAEVSAVQESESKRAFFAGAMCGVQLTAQALHDADGNVAQANANVRELTNEVRAFADQVIKGAECSG